LNAAIEGILDDAVPKDSRQGLNFCRLHTKDELFNQAFIDSVWRIVKVQKANL
jgi:hypothetical protein